MKEKVYRYLKEHEGTYVSGQDMAKELGVTRTSIWKAMEDLREEGVEIEAVTRKGYRLMQKNGPLQIEKVRNALPPHLRDTKIYHYETIDSTNDEAARLDEADTLPTFTLFTADAQTQGKGRSGKNFSSPSQTGLYLSLILKAEDVDLDLATVKAAVATFLAVEASTKRKAQIKWVNDIFLDGKKVSGILTEGKLVDGSLYRAIVGIGINFNTQLSDFPEEIRDIVTSLYPEEMSKEEFLALFIEKLYDVYFVLNKDEILQIYKDNSMVLGTEIFYYERDVEHRAMAVDINDEGNLIVDLDGERRTLAAGEISILGDWKKSKI